jgi:c-di-GMP-binding flagellar brake protein YcgR
MRAILYLFITLTLTMLAGCKSWDAAFHAGDSVDLIAASPTAVSYEYTTKFESIELPYTRDAANKECMRYQRRAGRRTVAIVTFERSSVTYTCE